MKYLIRETTKEEREKIVYKALGISLSGADYPSDYVMNLVKKYINGEKELDDIRNEVIDYYKRESGTDG